MNQLPVRIRIPYRSPACQHFSNIGAHGLLARVRGRIRMGLGIRGRVLALLRGTPAPAPRAREGAPSQYAHGTWVRVRGEDEVRATLDARARTRGLEFSPQMWFSCGRTYRVQGSVRRIIDDGGTLRPVTRTVLLEGVGCGGEHGTEGCGRDCPMMYRDEWLEALDGDPVSAAAGTAGGHGAARFARVRPIGEIARTLNLLGERDHLLFMPEMARFAGVRARVLREIDQVFEYNRHCSTPRPFYVLEGMHCSGEVLGTDGPCHRACRVVWHADWLEFDN